MTENQNPHPMQQFHDLIANVLAEGKRRPNRTGVDTFFVPGSMLKFDMADGFPAITTKKLAFKAARGELFGFFRGYDNAQDFADIDCKVWFDNANKTKPWVTSPFRKGENDLGRIYGKQWTDWLDWRTATTTQEYETYLAKGYEEVAYDENRHTWVMRRGMNQLEIVLRSLMTNPTDRRMIVTAWRPDEFDQMALPPCHVDYQFLADVEERKLHLCFYQRSFDLGLGFNVVLGALFLHIMARLAGYEAGTMSHFIGDGHVYVNHVEQLEELLTREHYAQPTLEFGPSIQPLKSVEEIPGIFTRISHEDVTLKDYVSHPALKMPMAA